MAKTVKPRIPKSVRVAGLEWTIRFEPLLCAREQVYGKTSMHSQEIILDPTMSPEAIMSTFLHELIHVVNFQFGVTKILDDVKEEMVTNAIANGLYAAFKDNDIRF